MDSSYTIQALEERIKTLKNSFPENLPINSFKEINLLRSVWLRESIFHRITELAESAYESCIKDKLISAIILTRAIMETEAFFDFFSDKLEGATDSKNTDLNDFLTIAFRGVHKDTAKELGRESAPNTLKYIDNMDKKIPFYRKQFEFLSEFSHPNSAGVSRSFSKIDHENQKIIFGANREKLDINFVIKQLITSLDWFMLEYDRSAELLEKLATNFDNTTLVSEDLTT